jgi:hypothetical protein
MSTKKVETSLEERQTKALETIASSLDALSLWFEEIDKDEWGERIQYYLSEFHEIFDLRKENE